MQEAKPLLSIPLFRNGISAGYQTNTKITIMDPKNAVVFEDTRAMIFQPAEPLPLLVILVYHLAL